MSSSTMLLVLFVLAAVPAVSLARGLDPLGFIESTSQEQHRRESHRDCRVMPKGIAVAARLARTLSGSQAKAACASALVSAPAEGPGSVPTAAEPVRAGRSVRVALLALPPPGR